MMRLLFVVFFFSSMAAFSQESCTSVQLLNMHKFTRKVCQDHVKEFAERSSANCAIKKIGANANVCFAECKDDKMAALAKLRVDMKPDCGREVTYYKKTVIKYYR